MAQVDFAPAPGSIEDIVEKARFTPRRYEQARTILEAVRRHVNSRRGDGLGLIRNRRNITFTLPGQGKGVRCPVRYLADALNDLHGTEGWDDHSVTEVHRWIFGSGGSKNGNGNNGHGRRQGSVEHHRRSPKCRAFTPATR